MTSFYGQVREKNILSDEEENRVSRENVDKWIFRLLLILVGFMPLVVLAHVEDVASPVVSNIGLLSSGAKGDLFTYYKSLIILIITVVAGLLLLMKVFFMNGEIKKTKMNFILGIFVIAIVMSSILSPNISIALNGQYNRSDGAISWLCYVILMFIAMNINYPKKAVNYIIYSLYPFVFINLIIITMNFTGNDLMQKEWMQSLVSIFMADGATISAESELVGTLNQWNYMSGMFAVMTVLFLAWSIVEENWISSIVNAIVAVVSTAVMLMSLSTSGFVTFLFMLIFLLLLIFKVGNKKKGIISLVIFLALSSIVLHSLSKENSNVWTESVGFFLDKNPYMVEQSVSKNSWDIEIGITDKAYAADNSFVLPVLPEPATAAGTGRVYIWEKSLELLKERPIFGYGLDSFMYNFPHYNIDARAGLKNEHTIVDKTHNLFMGTLYGTGIIGFVTLIAIVIMLFVSTVINIFNKKNLKFSVLGLAVIAFFVQSIFNDSLPGTSAIIWVFMGIMFAGIYQSRKVEE